MRVVKSIILMTGLVLLTACQSTSSGTSAQSTMSAAPATAPAGVLTSRAETLAFLNGKSFEEYSQPLEVMMVTEFASNGNLSQAPMDRDEVTLSNVSYERDGRVCNQSTKECFYVRPSFVGFEMVAMNGAVIKTLETIPES